MTSNSVRCLTLKIADSLSTGSPKKGFQSADKNDLSVQIYYDAKPLQLHAEGRFLVHTILMDLQRTSIKVGCTTHTARATAAIVSYNWFTLEGLAQKAVNGWMNSKGHRENILKASYDRTGIGVAVAEDGKVYFTQNFC